MDDRIKHNAGFIRVDKTVIENNMNPLISIGIPIYNAEKFLSFAIRSVINQSYKNWELILTDDGSSDKSVEIAKEYLFDSRIKLIIDPENKGLNYRLNQQITLAKGKYFARMDADDIMHPERIQQQVAFLESHPHIDVVGSAAFSIDIHNQIQGLLPVNPHPLNLKDVFKHRCFIHPAITAKSDWFRKNRYSEKYYRMEDTELWARTILQSKFRNIEVPLLYYRAVGIPYLSKYLSSNKGERKLIRTVYPCLSFTRFHLLSKNFTKIIIYLIFDTFGMLDVLIKRRAIAIDMETKAKAETMLNIAIK
jgi:glycosyltransferase involved in cell wall biosynthesis